MAREPASLRMLAVSAPSTPSAGPLTKGTVLLETLDVLRERFGEPALQRVYAAVEPASRQVLADGPLSNEWYPLDVLTGLMQASLELNEGGDEAKVIANAEQVVAHHLSGVYAIFVRFGSPEWIVKRIAAVHATYFRNVEISHTFDGPRRARIRYRGFLPQHRILELAIVGFYRKALELSGAKERAVRVTSSIAGADVCELELAWS